MAERGGQSLGDLLKARGVAVSTPAPTPPPPPSPAAGGIDLSRCGKLVLRRERKGRGGKTATVIEGLGLKAAALEQTLKTLRKALGCGGSIDGDHLVLNGDLCERADAWLRAHGATRTVIGN